MTKEEFYGSDFPHIVYIKNWYQRVYSDPLTKDRVYVLKDLLRQKNEFTLKELHDAQKADQTVIKELIKALKAYL